MKQVWNLMVMPITLEVVDPGVTAEVFDQVKNFFIYVDNKFSTYKDSSEISLINQDKILPTDYSIDMKIILKLAEKTKRESHGFFDIYHNGKIDPSGVAKGWAIFSATQILKSKGHKNFYLDAGGDVQVSGKNSQNKTWTIGIKNPFRESQVIKIILVTSQGVATSGIYIRGNHIYNPHGKLEDNIVSLTLVGPSIIQKISTAPPRAGS